MTPLPNRVDAITLFVESLEESKAFYADVFGLAVLFEDQNSAVFKFDGFLINLLKIPAARGLVAPEAVAPPDAGSRFQFTVPVGNVDEVCKDLEARAVKLVNGPMNRPWGIRTASFKDPGGHIWEIAHPLRTAKD
jgi:catechol 2,3-dioxygenase-like lactoylglutathione lyase family enzyme